MNTAYYVKWSNASLVVVHFSKDPARDPTSYEYKVVIVYFFGPKIDNHQHPPRLGGRLCSPPPPPPALAVRSPLTSSSSRSIDVSRSQKIDTLIGLNHFTRCPTLLEALWKRDISVYYYRGEYR